MTKTLSINDITIQTVVTLAKEGDEIVLEENGTPIARITPITVTGEPGPTARVFGLGKGKTIVSDDFDDELPDEFWGFEKQ